VLLTLSASNFAVTEESTPPDIATTTGCEINRDLSSRAQEDLTYPCRLFSGHVSRSHNKSGSVTFAVVKSDIVET
jgi:hypothetical protein